MITVKRYSDDGDATLGLLFIDGVHSGYTLEDEHRLEKVKGETRIPAGKYEVKKREVSSPMTVQYQQKYEWFDYHLELQDVPNFEHVYIHIGNWENQTDGCLLVGFNANTSLNDCKSMVSNSRDCFQELYLQVSERLKESKVYITIHD